MPNAPTPTDAPHAADAADADALVAAVADGAATVEVVAAALGAVEALERRAREARAALKQAMVEHIEATGRDIVVGEVRYYVGTRKVTKCVDVSRTVEEVLAAVNGDFNSFADCLASGAFKYGACRAQLHPDIYARLFVTSEVADLAEGKPKRQLLTAMEDIR